MLDQVVLGGEFFRGLELADAEIAEVVRQARCSRCRGPLHRSDYSRKPRGGLVAVAGETQSRRISFCCDECRARSTPPSLRFLGRRVYLEACVIVASIVSMRLRGRGEARAVRMATGVPARTVARWRSWWTAGFRETGVFVELASRFVGLAASQLPRAIFEGISGSVDDRLERMARWVAPLTTRLVVESRFLRGPA